MAGEELAQFNEGPHDLDIHLNGALAMEDTREHGHALLGENVGEIAAPTVST